MWGLGLWDWGLGFRHYVRFGNVASGLGCSVQGTSGESNGQENQHDMGTVIILGGFWGLGLGC